MGIFAAIGLVVIVILAVCSLVWPGSAYQKNSG